MTPSTLKDHKVLLYTLNDLLADCVTFQEQRRGAHTARPLSLTENSYLRKLQKQLLPIHSTLAGIKADDDADAAPFVLPWWMTATETDDSLERLLYGACEIHGFNQQVKNLVDMLLKPKPVGIVGMGGSGKTALAQLALNGVLSEKKFQMGYWVSLSEPLEQPKGTGKETKMLVKCVEEDSNKFLWVNRQEWTIGELFDKVLTSGGNCLIVLDGAKPEHISYLNEEIWLRLLSQNGVIVTTRLREVAETMVGKGNLYHMQFISDPDKIWWIFKDTVEEIGMIDLDDSTLLNMKDEIVERCFGLPLAAKTLAEIIPRRIYEVDG
ncbi:hypothetical protein L1049_000124 [Liquidambar formosana]|uniref:NB-ARC domain-containing protein n=1 Tax=Liquidambar formosana TaxID=63359 RepID=A0AAP0N8D5_LIQFO